MAKFLAMRIYEGKLTYDEVPAKYKDKVKELYKEMYGVDL